MTVFKMKSLWDPGELHYEYISTGNTHNVQAIIDEVNNLYKPLHGGKLLLTLKTGNISDTKVMKIVNQSGGSGGIGKTSRKKNFECLYDKPTNIRHELLHVLGFEHETFHRAYNSIYKLFCSRKSAMLKWQESDYKTMKEIEKVTQEIILSMDPKKTSAKFTVKKDYDFVGQNPMRRKLINGKLTDVEPKKSPKLKLEQRISGWAGISIQYISAYKRRKTSDYYHSPSPDNKADVPEANSVMMYTEIHKTINEAIQYYNNYLMEDDELAKKTIGKKEDLGKCRILELGKTPDKVDSFTKNEKYIIKHYGMNKYPE